MKSLYVPIWPITGNVRRFRCVAALQAAGNEPTEDSLKLEKAIIRNRPEQAPGWESMDENIRFGLWGPKNRSCRE
ncbi:hypothetical protein ABIC86_002530 [Paenibacillus sp. DS2363]